MYNQFPDSAGIVSRGNRVTLRHIGRHDCLYRECEIRTTMLKSYKLDYLGKMRRVSINVDYLSYGWRKDQSEGVHVKTGRGSRKKRSNQLIGWQINKYYRVMLWQ